MLAMRVNVAIQIAVGRNSTSQHAQHGIAMSSANKALIVYRCKIRVNSLSPTEINFVYDYHRPTPCASHHRSPCGGPPPLFVKPATRACAQRAASGLQAPAVSRTAAVWATWLGAFCSRKVLKRASLAALLDVHAGIE